MSRRVRTDTGTQKAISTSLVRWTLALWVVSAGGLARGSVPFVTPPYLQYLQPDGITVMWEAREDVAAAVEFGPELPYTRREDATREPSGSRTFIYKCRLSGLTPDTVHHYRVVANGVPDVDRTFRTAPAGPADFSFGVWSDSQGSNHGAYPADPAEPTVSMMRHLATSGAAFGMAVGDMAENGASYADTRRYYLDRVARFLGTRIPWFVAWGNHDQGRTAVIRKFADQPSQTRPRLTPGYGSFSFDYGGCHFVCLDHALAGTDIRNWLRGDLEAAAQRHPRFTFLFVHEPPYCELWFEGNASYRQSLVPLLEEFDVDVCFSGHTHEYSRGFRNGVFYCVTGGGSWLDTPEVLVKDWPHMTVGGYHSIPGVRRPGPNRGGGLINEYVRVEVRGDTFTASMIGFRPDGSVVGVLDTFSKRAEDTGSPAPLPPVLSGPERVDYFRDEELHLSSSAFADPNGHGVHARSVWRLSLIPAPDAVSPWTWETVTEGSAESVAIPTRELAPGRTLFAAVRQEADDGRSSPWSEPWAVWVGPRPVRIERFDTTPEFQLPPGWTTGSRTWTDVTGPDPDNPRSDTYRVWTVVSADRLGTVFGENRVNVPNVVDGHCVYAESDHRKGAQITWLVTPDYDLRALSQTTVTFLSNYQQNQDSLGALECSVDRGLTWRPLLYLLDQKDVVRRPADGTIDAASTFARVDPDGVPTAGGRAASGGTYGEHILSRPFEALDDFIQARVNDDPLESKRLERVAVPEADGQAAVRFRFAYVGTSSWFWGLDDFAIFGAPAPLPPLRFTAIQREGDAVRLSWSGGAGPVKLLYREALESGGWRELIETTTPGELVIPAGTTGARFYRLVAGH